MTEPECGTCKHEHSLIEDVPCNFCNMYELDRYEPREKEKFFDSELQAELDSGGEKTQKYDYCPQYEGDFDDMDKEKPPEPITPEGLDIALEVGVAEPRENDILDWKYIEFKNKIISEFGEAWDKLRDFVLEAPILSGDIYALRDYIHKIKDYIKLERVEWGDKLK